MPGHGSEAAATKKNSATGPAHRRPNRQVRPVAQPPASVIRSFKPVGQLQLHRLAKHVGFRCIICRQRKTANLVAIRKGNWTQKVCYSCHNAELEKARKAAKAKRLPAQAMQRPPSKVRVRQVKRVNGSSANPATTKGEEHELKRRKPGADRLLEFFHAACVDADLKHGGCLRINGSETGPLAQLPGPETPEWINTVNELALKYAHDKFVKAVEDNARLGEDLRASLLPRERGFAIMRGDVRLAVIHPAHASIPHRPFIYANFLTPGPHWQQVATVLHDAEAELAAERKREQAARAATVAATAADAERQRAAARRRIDQLPAHLAPELIDACLNASRRIRLERQVAYDRPVVLKFDVGELTLLPIAGTETRLRMPFCLNKGTETLNGELVLGDSDPLPLVIGQAVADNDAITAWTSALLGFADATCIELEPTGPTARRASARSRWQPPASVSRRRPSEPALPRARRWPSHLEPVGHWVRFSGSFVAGHRRRLNEDQTASDEARDRARQVGIILHRHETWVRPHARGVPGGIEMRFRWHAPTELKLSGTSARS
jgi:hypothetical protein